MVRDSGSVFRLIALVGAMLIAAGCGGSGDQTVSETSGSEPGDDAPAVDLCTFLTASDIEEVLGVTPGESVPGSEDVGSCSWSSLDGSGPLVELVLDEAIYDSFDDFVMDYGEEFGGENPPRERFHPVEGLGDWAMYVADESTVRVFRGDAVLDVRSDAANQDEETLRALAERAIAHWE